MATKKGASSSSNGRDSEAKRLGVKRFGGQQVKAGEILVRQTLSSPSRPAPSSSASGATVAWSTSSRTRPSTLKQRSSIWSPPHPVGERRVFVLHG